MMMQQWIVGAIVVYAFWVVAKRYLPKSIRRILRAWAARIAGRLGWRDAAAKLEARAEAGASCGDGCGACGNCGPEEKNAVPKEFAISVEELKRTATRS